MAYKEKRLKGTGRSSQLYPNDRDRPSSRKDKGLSTRYSGSGTLARKKVNWPRITRRPRTKGGTSNSGRSKWKVP